MSITTIALTVTAVILIGGKPVGYLIRVGPAPLRFQSPAKGPEHTVALPPLAMKDPEPPPPEVQGPPAPPENTEPVVVEAKPPPPPPPPDPMQNLTPQMLIQYFSRGGTNAEPTVVVPYQFAPPPGNPLPPSSATYTKK